MRNIAFIFPVLLMVGTLACEKPKDVNAQYEWKAYANPAILKASIYDTLPKKTTKNVLFKEINGIQITYASGKQTRYFEYETDPEILIKIISALPFEKGNTVNDTLCRKIENVFSLSGSKVLSNKEVAASAFFWQIDPSKYDYFECLKYPTRHTLLINKTTRRVLHRVES